MEAAISIRLSEVSAVDRIELEKELPPGTIRFEEPLEAGDLHGELATATAVVIVSLAALRVLAVHLARPSRREKLTRRVEVTYADGSRQVTTLKYSGTSAEGPEAAVLKELSSVCGIDAALLEKE